MLRLIAVLLLIPLLDALLLLAVVAPLFGVLEAVLLVVLTGLVGMLLVRAEGRHTLRKIQRKLAEGKAPTNELVDGGLLLIAGAFLLTPGLVTDLIGFVLVIPFTRYPVRLAVKKWVITPYVDAKTGGFATGNVYIGGFPGTPDGEGGPQQGPGPQRRPGEGGQSSEDVYDLGDDYDVEFDDDRDARDDRS